MIYQDEWLTVYGGDCRAVLSTMAPESVHCVVTSPPYWGLRDYGAEGQLGLEPTPEQYVENMVAVFREVRRVLRNDGTLWLNLGDSYASHDPGGYREGEFLNPGGRQSEKGRGARNRAGNYRPGGLKPKDLVGIPWRVAFALQADGWYLRSDIIWSKSNPMPESVTDRPTKSHEYLFLLAKSPRYYFDAEAVRENGDAPPDVRLRSSTFAKAGMSGGHHNGAEIVSTVGRNIRSVWTIPTTPYGSMTRDDASGPSDTLSPDCPVHSLRAIRRSLQTDGDDALLDHLRSRNRRSDARPAPMPDDGLFASSLLDSQDDRHATPGSLTPGSSQTPTSQNTGESRTPAPPTIGDGLELGDGTGSRTSRTPDRATSAGQDATTGAGAATRRNGHASRTTAPFAPLGSDELSSADHRRDIDERPDAGDQLPRRDASNRSEGSDQRGPSGQTDADTTGRCTCVDNSMSHFAVFPPKLVEPCIKAGTSEKGACPECGAPWVRVVETHRNGRDWNANNRAGGNRLAVGQSASDSQPVDYRPPTTIGWQPSCAHTAEPVPATVLDVFAGSGTTGMVAQSLSRRAVLIDLSPAYIEQQLRRNRDVPLGLSA